MEEKKKDTGNRHRRVIAAQEMDLSECGKYQELNGSWVIWMLISGIILCFKNLYSGIALIAISVAIFIFYKKNPKNISATYFNLALDNINRGEISIAKENLKKSVEVNSENNIAYVLLSSIYYKEGNFKKTIDSLLKSNVLKVPNSKYNYLVGACYYNIEDYQNSIKYLNSIKFEENNMMKNVKDVLLAKAYCLSEQYKQALKVFKRVENIRDELKGNLLEFNYFLGLTYFKVNEKSKARIELEKVYKQNSEYRNVQILIDSLN